MKLFFNILLWVDILSLYNMKKKTFPNSIVLSPRWDYKIWSLMNVLNFLLFVRTDHCEVGTMGEEGIAGFASLRGKGTTGDDGFTLEIIL